MDVPSSYNGTLGNGGARGGCIMLGRSPQAIYVAYTVPTGTNSGANVDREIVDQPNVTRQRVSVE